MTISDDQPTKNDSSLSALTDTVSHLTANAAEAQDNIDALREDLLQHSSEVRALHDKFDSLAEALKASVPGINNPAFAQPTRAQAGIPPLAFIEKHLGWVTQSLLSNIVACKMEPKDLILLLPEEDRPNRKAATRTNLHFDAQAGKLVTVDEPYTTFDKDFPSLEYLIYALTVYGTIRALYDSDNIGISAAIFLHVKRITRDALINKYDWRSIVAYTIAHFRKHQKSSDVLDWINADSELFLSYIKAPQNPVAAVPNRSPAKTNTRPATSQDHICRNYNTLGKGCTWAGCMRKHICLTCSLPGHPAYNCPPTTAPDKPKKTNASKSDPLKVEKA